MTMLDTFTAQFKPIFYATRGQIKGAPAIETVSFGALSIVDDTGHEYFSVGDSSAAVHARSTLKAVQLLPLLLAGGQEQFKLLPKDINVLSSSHDGSDMHVKRLFRLMTDFKIWHDDLQCGVHPPYNRAVRLELSKGKKRPSVLHNNCSGKHVGMLLTCKLMGWPLHNYLEINHPLQQEILQLIGRLGKIKVADIGIACDGCSAPTFILPLKNLARIYATLAWPQNFSDPVLVQSLALLFHSASNFPKYIAGADRPDTLIMQAAAGKVMAKTGADGGYALAIAPSAAYPRGLGVAIKIADGDPTHLLRTFCAVHILKELGIISKNYQDLPIGLQRMVDNRRLNAAGLCVGEYQCAFLDSLSPLRRGEG